jgi:hypothetical protein
MPTTLDPFDPATLQLPVSILPRKSTKPPRHRPGEWFLRGPIPWPWLEAAASLPGKALTLSLVLWREAGRRKNHTIKLCLGRVDLGVKKAAARRALRRLERAELVTVHRKPGRGLEVTILEAPCTAPSAAAP